MLEADIEEMLSKRWNIQTSLLNIQTSLHASDNNMQQDWRKCQLEK